MLSWDLEIEDSTIFLLFSPPGKVKSPVSAELGGWAGGLHALMIDNVFSTGLNDRNRLFCPEDSG